MIRKIAIFRALYLGDMLVAVPALRALRQHFPSAEMTLIGLPWAADFVRRYAAYLNRFVEFAGYPGLPEVEFCQERMQACIEEQRAYHYDLAIQMHGNGQRSNAFINELQADVTVGYFPAQQEGANAALTMSAPYPADRHEIHRNLDLAAMLGCTQLDSHLEFPLWTSDFREIRHLLQTWPELDSPWIGFHVGSRHPARRWPPANFAELADRLAHKHHTRIIFTGGPDERPVVQEVIRAMNSKPINLAGHTSQGGLAALLTSLDLFISNDTGPAHLAYALDVPSITLFGPTDYQRWRPLARERHRTLRAPVACSPCTHRVCPIDQRCLTRISPLLVSRVATTLLEHRQPLSQEIDPIHMFSPEELYEPFSFQKS